jgi:hypothetical protein
LDTVTQTLLCFPLQSPEAETKGVLLGEEGVISKEGARIFKSSQAYTQALEDAGLGEHAQETAAAPEEEVQERAAVSGV